jgi:hypothetical protein
MTPNFRVSGIIIPAVANCSVVRDRAGGVDAAASRAGIHAETFSARQFQRAVFVAITARFWFNNFKERKVKLRINNLIIIYYGLNILA